MITSDLDKQARYASIGGMLWTLLCLYALVCVILMAFYDWQRMHRSSEWKTTMGVIERWDVEYESSEGKDYHTPYASYRYVVEGQQFRGSGRDLQVEGLAGYKSFPDQELALASLRLWPIDTEVQVFYDPSNPYDAALDVSNKSFEWLKAFGMTAMFASGMGLGLIVLRKRPGPPFWMAVVLVVLVACVAVRPFEGSAEEISGGDSDFESFKATALSRRQAWTSLRKGSSEADIAPFLESFERRDHVVSTGKTIDFRSDRKPHMERAAEIKIRRHTKGPEMGVVDSFTSPYYDSAPEPAKI